MVWDSVLQTLPEMELNSTRNNEKFCRKWTSSVLVPKPIFQ